MPGFFIAPNLEVVGQANRVTATIEYGVIGIVIDLLIQHVVHASRGQHILAHVVTHTNIDLV